MQIFVENHFIDSSDAFAVKKIIFTKHRKRMAARNVAEGTQNFRTLLNSLKGFDGTKEIFSSKESKK